VLCATDYLHKQHWMRCINDLIQKTSAQNVVSAPELVDNSESKDEKEEDEYDL